MNDASLPARRARPRLDPSVYHGYGHPIHVILCTKDRATLFGPGQCLSETVISLLRRTAEDKHVELHAFCLMPDHLHVVLSIPRGGVGVAECIRLFRQRIHYATRAEHPEPLWQRSFYDHVIRSGEGLGRTCEYVVNNPVRKGLVDRWERYPYAWLSDGA